MLNFEIKIQMWEMPRIHKFIVDYTVIGVILTVETSDSTVIKLL